MGRKKRAVPKAVQNAVKGVVRRQIRRRGGLGMILLLIVFVAVGLFNPELRDKIAEQLNVPFSMSANGTRPLPSKTKSPLKEGVWPAVHIVDGDTLDIQDDQGVKHRVRLIGANTPETVKPNSPVEPFGPEASAFTKRIIEEAGGKVRVAFDGDQVDRYDRNLAMIYVQTPRGEVWLNKMLIHEGLARAQLQYRFSKGAKEAFRVAEEEAKRARKNIWSQVP